MTEVQAKVVEDLRQGFLRDGLSIEPCEFAQGERLLVVFKHHIRSVAVDMAGAIWMLVRHGAEWDCIASAPAASEIDLAVGFLVTESSDEKQVLPIRNKKKLL